MKFIDKSVFLEEENVLVISDLHLGYEEYLNERGVLVPRQQYNEIIENLEKIFEGINIGKKKTKDEKGRIVGKLRKIINKQEKTHNRNVRSLFINNKENNKIKKIIILGDLKHEFGTVNRQEWNDVLSFLDFLEGKLEKNGKIILIKGNHDSILEPIAEKKNLEIKSFYSIGENLFLHGDKYVKKVEGRKIKRVFLGHLHPAISIREGAKSEVYKCFLKGKWKSKEVIILPSFFPLIEGSDVQIYDTNLDKEFKFNLKNFEVFVPVSENEVLKFGRLRDVGRLV